VGHGIHEQVDIASPILKIVEWFEVVKTFHELVEILIE